MSATDKQQLIIEIFQKLSSMDEKYVKIIEMGRALPPLSETARVQENLVQGCQSILYLEAEARDGRVYFNADSEALISKGLAALLIYVYSGEVPEALFKEPPHFLKGIGLHQALSPARSNGLASLFKKMQESAIKILSLSNPALPR